jgi:ketosteroid isomerase-like protein
MHASTPDEAEAQFAALMGSGDLSQALSLYERDAALLPDPATLVSGEPGIRSGLAGLFALRPTLTSENHRVVVAGDIALVLHEWRLSGTLPDGTPLVQHGRSADVLRRQDDGGWRFVIDNPWGTAVLDAAAFHTTPSDAASPVSEAASVAEGR